MTTLTPSTALPGLMQHTPLTLETIFERFRTVYADGRLVDHEYQTTYGEVADRILRLARVLTGELGVRPGDRVATFGHNSIRHFELYYAVPLVGAVLHTINVRLFDDQIVWIANHAQDVGAVRRRGFPRSGGGVRPRLGTDRTIVGMGRAADGSHEVVELPADVAIDGPLDHDELIAAAEPLEDRPPIDEDAAFGPCYTSGTTGDPKGVLYSHRAMTLHSFATCMVDHIGLSERDVVFPVVPMSTRSRGRCPTRRR